VRRSICRGLVAALILVTPAAALASGELDTSFGHDGKVTTGFASRTSFARAVAIQADGRIVAVGAAGPGYGVRFVLARYTRKGNLDRSFGGDGRVSLDFRRGQTQAYDVAIQANGKIVVVGRDPFKFAVARLKPDGTLDRSFGSDGKVTTGFAGSGAEARAVAIQGDGKIVVAGANYPGCGGDDSAFALARYRRDGSLDPTFGDHGKVTTDVGSPCEPRTVISALAIQGDGKIVAVGAGYPNGGSSEKTFVLARYDTQGALDPTFGGDGLVTTEFADSGASSGADVALGGDGAILAAGWATFETAAGSRNRFALARYLMDGTLDSTFSDDGMVSTGFPTPAGSGGCGCSGAQASDVAIQADGGIVALGTARGHHSWIAMARYEEDGTLDPTFGGDGRVANRFGDAPEAFGLAIQDDERIVAAGEIGRRFALARYRH
jgi:uncharacterized delta-60 repeat protein